MKKMFTLFAGLIMSIAVFSADRRPTVMLNNNSRQYKVVIDGRAYFGDNIRIDLDNNYDRRNNNGYGDNNGYGNHNGYGTNSGYGSNNGYGNNRVHTIKVYEMRNGFFQRERLIDSRSFSLGKRDMIINVDRFGTVSIREFKARGRDNRDRFDDRNDRDDRNGRDDRDWNDRDRNDRDNRF